jgi:hypothetical protein
MRYEEKYEKIKIWKERRGEERRGESRAEQSREQHMCIDTHSTEYG